RQGAGQFSAVHPRAGPEKWTRFLMVLATKNELRALVTYRGAYCLKCRPLRLRPPTPPVSLRLYDYRRPHNMGGKPCRAGGLDGDQHHRPKTELVPLLTPAAKTVECNAGTYAEHDGQNNDVR